MGKGADTWNNDSTPKLSWNCQCKCSTFKTSYQELEKEHEAEVYIANTVWAMFRLYTKRNKGLLTQSSRSMRWAQNRILSRSNTFWSGADVRSSSESMETRVGMMCLHPESMRVPVMVATLAMVLS
eukprot:1817815-Rhodomonas_salina.1